MYGVNKATSDPMRVILDVVVSRRCTPDLNVVRAVGLFRNCNANIVNVVIAVRTIAD